VSSLENRPHHFPNTTGETEPYTYYSLDAAGSPYISEVYTFIDVGNPTQLAKETTQTVDQYGNVSQMQVYGYGIAYSNLPLLRTYTKTYLGTSAYTSLYILNRLLTSTLTDGTYTDTLVSPGFFRYKQFTGTLSGDIHGFRDEFVSTGRI
jgi:hypothetical protein